MHQVATFSLFAVKSDSFAALPLWFSSISSNGFFRWAKQQREEVHHMELPGINHMGILRDFEPAKKIAAIIENLNKQLYEDEKYLDFEEYPKVEILL